MRSASGVERVLAAFVLAAVAAPSFGQTTTRMSLDSAGVQANGESFIPAISADGRYVAFASDASNLVPDDTNGFRDVFVRDRVTGTTVRVSVDSTGLEADDASAELVAPSISADGR